MRNDRFICEAHNAQDINKLFSSRYETYLVNAGQLAVAHKWANCAFFKMNAAQHRLDYVSDVAALQRRIKAGSLQARVPTVPVAPPKESWRDVLTRAWLRAHETPPLGRLQPFPYENKRYVMILKREREHLTASLKQHYLNPMIAKKLGLPVLNVVLEENHQYVLVISDKLDAPRHPGAWVDSMVEFHKLITLPVLKALNLLHSAGYVHGEFTDANMYLSEKYRQLIFLDFKHLGVIPYADRLCWEKMRYVDMYDAVSAIIKYADAMKHLPVEQDHLLNRLRVLVMGLEFVKPFQGVVLDYPIEDLIPEPFQITTQALFEMMDLEFRRLVIPKLRMM